MHQTLIRAGGEWMGAFSRDRRFRRHPGVTNGVRAGHAIKLETGRNFVGAPDLLENLHAPAAAYNLDALGVPDRGDNSPLANRRHSDNQMRVVSLMSGYGRAQSAQQLFEIKIGGCAERQLTMIGSGVSVNRKPGRVRPAITERSQHSRQQMPEFGLQFRVLQKDARDAAHAPDNAASRKSSQVYRQLIFLLGNTGVPPGRGA